MDQTAADRAIAAAIGGDEQARARVLEQAEASALPLVAVTAAVLSGDPGHLERAGTLARRARDRQVVAIARALLDGDLDLLQVLAREHLVDHPDSLLVAWIVSRAQEPS